MPNQECVATPFLQRKAMLSRARRIAMNVANMKAWTILFCVDEVGTHVVDVEFVGPPSTNCENCSSWVVCVLLEHNNSSARRIAAVSGRCDASPASGDVRVPLASHRNGLVACFRLPDRNKLVRSSGEKGWWWWRLINATVACIVYTQTACCNGVFDVIPANRQRQYALVIVSGLDISHSVLQRSSRPFTRIVTETSIRCSRIAKLYQRHRHTVTLTDLFSVQLIAASCRFGPPGLYIGHWSVRPGPVTLLFV